MRVLPTASLRLSGALASLFAGAAWWCFAMVVSSYWLSLSLHKHRSPAGQWTPIGNGRVVVVEGGTEVGRSEGQKEKFDVFGDQDVVVDLERSDETHFRTGEVIRALQNGIPIGTAYDVGSVRVLRILEEEYAGVGAG